MPTSVSTSSTAGTFGDLLRQLRRRAGLTQRELAALVGFSIAQISLLEKNQRLPDLAMVSDKFAPALSLADEPRLLQRLLALAAQARGERPPLQIQMQRTVQVQATVTHEWVEAETLLPASLAPLLGRRREIDAAVARLTHAPGRLLTLLGPPGVGKTRLALAIAAQLQAFFAGGACIVPLAGVATPAQLAPAIAAALEAHDGGKRTPQQRLTDHLRHKELLLVLDDFEHLLAPQPGSAAGPNATGLLVHLLAACPRLHLLVTSREPLRVRAEQRLKVHPLAPAAAAELFAQRAEAVDPDFFVTTANLPIIAEICLRLDCLPLAVELMAARIDLLTPQAMLARLADNRLDLLGDGPDDLPPHQKTLRRAIERSYALLDAYEQQLFRRCGVFAGTFDLAAAEACVPMAQVAEHLQSLLAKSLIKTVATEDGERRFVLLETLRAYALEQLLACGETSDQHARHAAYYAALAAQTSRQAAARPLACEVQNLVAALQWLVRCDGAAALQMVADLRVFWYATGRFDEGRSWAQQALAANSAAPVANPTARAGTLLTLGQMLLNQGDTAAARQHLGEAAGLFRRLGDRDGNARALIELGWAVYLAHEQKVSVALFEECLALAHPLGDAGLTAHALTSLTHVLVYEGAYTPQLLAYIEQSIALYRRLQDAHGLNQALLNLCVFHTQTGAYTAALAAVREAESVVAAGELSATSAWTHAAVAELLLLQGENLEEAGLRLETALAQFRDGGQRDGALIVQHHLGELARKQGRREEAVAYYRASHAAAVAGNDQRMVARCLAGLGQVALVAGDREAARRYLGAAGDLLRVLPAFLPPAALAEYEAAHCSARGEF